MDIGFLHGRVVFVQQNNHLFPIIAIQKFRQLMKCQRRVHIPHICRLSEKQILFLPVQAVSFQQKRASCVFAGKKLYDLIPRIFIIVLLDIRKRKADHRVCPLHGAVFFLLPDEKSIKQVAPSRIFDRKKLFRHTHGQGFPEAARSGNQGNTIHVFPPFLDKGRFIHIKAVIFYYFPKILNSDCSRHNSLPSPAFITHYILYTKTRQSVNEYSFSVYRNFTQTKSSHH